MVFGSNPKLEVTLVPWKSPHHRVPWSGSGLRLPDGSLLPDDFQGPEKQARQPTNATLGDGLGDFRKEWSWNDSFFNKYFPFNLWENEKKCRGYLVHSYFFRWATVVINSPANFHVFFWAKLIDFKKLGTYHLKWTSDGLSCSDKPYARSTVGFLIFSNLSCASDVFGQTWWDPNDRTGCFTCVNFFTPKTKMTQTKIHHRQSYVVGGLPGNWKTLGCVPKTILAVGRLVGTRVGGAFHENFLQKTSAGKRQAKSAKTRRVDEKVFWTNFCNSTIHQVSSFIVMWWWCVGHLWTQ